MRKPKLSSLFTLLALLGLALQASAQRATARVTTSELTVNVSVVDGVATAPISGHAEFAVARNGTLVYAPGAHQPIAIEPPLGS